MDSRLHTTFTHGRFASSLQLCYMQHHLHGLPVPSFLFFYSVTLLLSAKMSDLEQ
jgi:hypothetical protein